VDTLTQALLVSDQIVEVTPLPTLMIPSKISIPTRITTARKIIWQEGCYNSFLQSLE